MDHSDGIFLLCYGMLMIFLPFSYYYLKANANLGKHKEKKE